MKERLDSCASKRRQQGSLHKAFTPNELEGDKIKSELEAPFEEELLEFHAPKQPHYVGGAKKELVLESRDKALHRFQECLLWHLLCTFLCQYVVHQGGVASFMMASNPCMKCST